MQVGKSAKKFLTSGGGSWCRGTRKRPLLLNKRALLVKRIFHLNVSLKAGSRGIEEGRRSPKKRPARDVGRRKVTERAIAEKATLVLACNTEGTDPQKGKKSALNSGKETGPREGKNPVAKGRDQSKRAEKALRCRKCTWRWEGGTRGGLHHQSRG